MTFLQAFSAFVSFSVTVVCWTLLVTRLTGRQMRQGVKYAYCGLKLLLGIALLPFLLPLFYIWNGAFMVAFTFLWPHLDILDEMKHLYLRRFFMTPKTQWFRPRFLHYIVQSDAGREPHDHPGPFTTTILAGGYIERTYYPCNQYMRDRVGLYTEKAAEPRDTLVNGQDHTHMLTLFEPTWTWVVGWKRGKPWGFWKMHPTDASKDTWIESEAYGVKGEEIRSWEVRS